jgi:hypothetical protein
MKLKLEKHMYFKGKEGRIISRALNDVIKEFSKRARVRKLKKIRIYITKNPVEVCKKIVMPRVKLARHGEMREWICQNAPSFSYWGKGLTPTIMMDANERVFQELNYPAIQGLFAHELMHLLNKLDGIEDELEAEAEEAATNMFKLLARHKEIKPLTQDKLLSSLIRITTSALLFIKDIFANTRAMSFGFDDELYENYKVTLADVKKGIKFTDNYIIKTLKKGRMHALDDAFTVYLGLNLSWITFKMFHNKMYEYLQDMSRIKAPEIIKKQCKPIIKEMLKLRSASDKKQIAKILRLTQQNYFNVVKYYGKRLR